MLQMDHAKLLDVLTSLPVSQSILPRAVCFATSRPANHAICSFIDSSGYASGPIRICLFIDYIIIRDILVRITYASSEVSYRQAVKAQTSLCIRTVSSEHSLFLYIAHGDR